MPGTGSSIREMIIVEKTADVDLINDNVLNDDAELKVSIAANEEMFFEVYAHYVAGAGGIKAAMSGPAGYEHLHYSANLDVSGATKVTSNLASAWDDIVNLASGSEGMVRITGMVHNGGNAGILVFRWAQNTSNGANTTIHQDSIIRVSRIG